MGEKTHIPDVASVVTVVHNRRPKKFGKKKKETQRKSELFSPSYNASSNFHFNQPSSYKNSGSL